MVAPLTPDILQELDRMQGVPLQLEDPRTHARYVLIPHDSYQRVLPLMESGQRSGSQPVEWSEARNSRRCALVDREVDGILTDAEQAELNALQQEFSDYREQVAPLPLALLDLVREALERRAAERAATSA